jgi:hypothetical protein
MSKLVNTAVAALFLLGATSAIAQNTPNEKKGTTQMAPKAPASDGAVRDEKPTDPNTPNNQSEIKKLEKDQKGKSTQ